MTPEARANMDVKKLAKVYKVHNSAVYMARKKINAEEGVVNPTFHPVQRVKGGTPIPELRSIDSIIRDVGRLRAIGDKHYIRELLTLMDKVS
jgi:hypothetical protein